MCVKGGHKVILSDVWDFVLGGTVTLHESRNGGRTLDKLIQLIRCQPSRISPALQTSSDRSKTIGGALTLRKGWTLRRAPPTPTSVLPIQLFLFSMGCRNSPSRRRTVDRHLCTEWRDPTNERQWEKKVKRRSGPRANLWREVSWELSCVYHFVEEVIESCTCCS